jgi:transcriptional regulator GlxA family with amidase domain
MVSICTGAFVLAAAGLLDGRRATTHWQKAAALARDYPAVTVDPHVLYVDEGSVLTSAGVAAGIDLCLHIIRADAGAMAANQRARALVAAPHRTGGQAQYIDRPALPQRTGALDELRAWALRHLDEPLTVDRMAREACLSRRTLIRRFHDETGLPPMHWLLNARIDRARELLEASGRAHGGRGTTVRTGHPRKPADPVQTPYRRPAQHVPQHIPPPRTRGRRGRSRSSLVTA